MSDNPIKDLRSDIVRAAHRRLRPWWRRRPALLALLATLLVAAPATAAIGGLWDPDVEPMAAMPTVTATAVTPASEGCTSGSFGFGQGPSTTNATPPPDLARRLSVLRSPQTAADRAGEAMFRRPGIGRVARRGIRLLGTDASGQRTWLAPVLMVIKARRATARCPRRPPSRKWLLAQIGQGGALLNARDIENEGSMGSSGPKPSKATVVGIVPDGVASVTVTYGSTPGRTWPVRRNFFTYRVALPVEQAYQGEITWNDSTGRPIKHVGRLGDGKP